MSYRCLNGTARILFIKPVRQVGFSRGGINIAIAQEVIFQHAASKPTSRLVRGQCWVQTGHGPDTTSDQRRARREHTPQSSFPWSAGH